MTARQVEIHPEALAEAAAAVAWYGERSSRAPAAFIEEIENAVESILEAPNRWPIYELDCRRLPLLRFPYFIVYREKSASLVQIVAVAHGRRRPVVGCFTAHYPSAWLLACAELGSDMIFDLFKAC